MPAEGLGGDTLFIVPTVDGRIERPLDRTANAVDS